MNADIDFYLKGAVEERLPQLTSPASPLELKSKHEDFCIIRSKNPVLNGFFVYCPVDSKTMSEEPLHIEAQRALGFMAGSILHYRHCILNPEKVKALRGIAQYLSSGGIPVYMTAVDDATGKEILIKGSNPETRTEIENPEFKSKELSDLLK